MSRRIKILTVAFAGFVVLLFAAVLVPVPLVALGPGPTFNTLGVVEGKPVVTVTGRPTYPTTGHLNMTTVSVYDGLTPIRVLKYWLAPDMQVVPRATIYPPGLSNAQTNKVNDALFQSSEELAGTEAFDYLHLPIKVLVAQLTPGAAATGKLQPGDRILAVNGQPVTTAAQLTQLLTTTHPGQQVTIGYQRGDTPQAQVVITLGQRPANLPGHQGFLGVQSMDQLADTDQVKIALAGVGGPSAGLMFTLAVVDKLTPDDLTGGRFIAGTGTMSPGGTVGPISGIPFKMIAAQRAGATVFLVPAANCLEASQHPVAGLQLIKVNALSDAVDSLTKLKAHQPVPSCSAP